MRDGLKIYACTGFGVGTAPEQFNYWLDNTETITNTKAVNSLLAEINFLSAKLCYSQDLTNKDVTTILNLLDFYTVCLRGAEEFDGLELARFGRIVGEMSAAGKFDSTSTDNDERDTNLDNLIAEAFTRLYDGEDPQIDNETTRWFNEQVVANDEVGLTDSQIERIREAIASKKGAIAGTTTDDAASYLSDCGGYYLYMYMTEAQAKKIGDTVVKRRAKEIETYNYMHKAYDMMFATPEEIDKIIYAGVCKQYGHTPEWVVGQLCDGKKVKGAGDPATILLILQIIQAVISIITAVLSIVLAIVSACLEAKYAAPDDPDFGTPFPEDLDGIVQEEDNKTKLGLLAAGALLLFGIFKK